MYDVAYAEHRGSAYACIRCEIQRKLVHRICDVISLWIHKHTSGVCYMRCIQASFFNELNELWFRSTRDDFGELIRHFPNLLCNFGNPKAFTTTRAINGIRTSAIYKVNVCERVYLVRVPLIFTKPDRVELIAVDVQKGRDSSRNRTNCLMLFCKLMSFYRRVDNIMPWICHLQSSI